MIACDDDFVLVGKKPQKLSEPGKLCCCGYLGEIPCVYEDVCLGHVEDVDPEV